LSRAPQPKRSEIAQEELAAYDTVVERFKRLRRDRTDEIRWEGDAGEYFGTLLNSPPFAEAWNRIGTLVRTAGERSNTYSHADREFVDQVLCADWKTNVVQVTHLPDAVAVGVRLEAIEALRSGREKELIEDERFLASYIRQVASGQVTDESFAALERRIGRRGAVEYTCFIGFLMMTIRLHQAFGHPDPSDGEVDATLRALKEGARTVPDYRVRLT
jgi:hypothetical protein